MLIVPNDYINAYFRKTRDISELGDGSTFQRVRPKVVMKSGLELSIQASQFHYCHPRLDEAEFYSQVEVGFPPYELEPLLPYAEDRDHPCDTVYGWVPVEIINALIEFHGGIDEEATRERAERHDQVNDA